MSPEFSQVAQIVEQIAPGTAAASLQSPAVPEVLGKAMAEKFAGEKADTVVVWDTVHSAVLGHVVARELSAELTYAYAEEGILGLSPEPEAGQRVVLVGYDWTEYPGLNALISLLSGKELVLVGFASVLAPPAASAIGDVPSLVLGG